MCDIGGSALAWSYRRVSTSQGCGRVNRHLLSCSVPCSPGVSARNKARASAMPPHAGESSSARPARGRTMLRSGQSVTIRMWGCSYLGRLGKAIDGAFAKPSLARHGRAPDTACALSSRRCISWAATVVVLALGLPSVCRADAIVSSCCLALRGGLRRKFALAWGRCLHIGACI